MTQIPTVNTKQMREVDRLMVEEYGIALIQMMENAGGALAESGRMMLGGEVAGKRIGVLCGAGNNGGGGMVAARHLHNWGAVVGVVLAGEASRLKSVPAKQWAILNKLNLASATINLDAQNLIVDALVGYGLHGDPRPPISDWIDKANRAAAPVLSLDAPSGLDTTSGQAGTPTVRAARTLTLALPKTGLVEAGARDYVGELYLADIGVPSELYEEKTIGIEARGLFTHERILKVRQ